MKRWRPIRRPIVITSYSIHYTKLYDAQEVRDALDAVDAAGVALADGAGTFRLSGPRDPSLRAFLFEPLSLLRIAVSRFAGLIRELCENLGEDVADDSYNFV